MTQFSLQSGGAPFTLQPNASQSIMLRFAPKYIGRTSGRSDLIMAEISAILTVFGQGLGGLVSIADDSGYAGDIKNIPMILGKVPAHLFNQKQRIFLRGSRMIERCFILQAEVFNMERDSIRLLSTALLEAIVFSLIFHSSQCSAKARYLR